MPSNAQVALMAAATIAAQSSDKLNNGLTLGRAGEFTKFLDAMEPPLFAPDGPSSKTAALEEQARLNDWSNQLYRLNFNDLHEEAQNAVLEIVALERNQK